MFIGKGRGRPSSRIVRSAGSAGTAKRLKGNEAVNKNRVLGAISLLAFTAPGAAWAANECGPINTSSNPQVVTCTGAFASGAVNGITYDEASVATKGDIELRLANTVAGSNRLDTSSTGATAVTLTGASDHWAQITGLVATQVVSGGNGFVANSLGTGAAIINSQGSVLAQGIGLYANGGVTGTASVTNAANAVLGISGSTMDQIGMQGAGTSVSLTNNGQITLDSSGGAYDAYGLVANGGGRNPGIVLTNNSSLSVTSGSGDAAGFVVNGSNNGAVAVNNIGTTTVNAGSGSAGGIMVDNGTGTVAISSTGVLTATSQSGSATGIGVSSAGNTSITLAPTAATSLAVHAGGGVATGIGTAASGTVTVNANGEPISVTNTNGDAIGIDIGSGSDISVGFANAQPGATLFTSDVTVTADGGAATGIAIADATGAVAVSHDGSALSVTSSTGQATGISVSGGTTVDITSMADAAAGRGAAITVLGDGATTGISVDGASAGETVSLADDFNVTSTNGSAAGVVLSGGTDQSVALTKGATIISAGDADGVVLANGSGTISVNAGDDLSVTGDGRTRGIAIDGGQSSDVVLNGDLSVSSSGNSSYGVNQDNVTGAQSVRIAGAVSVSNGADAVGIGNIGGTSQNITLEQGLVVAGGNRAIGIGMIGSGDPSLPTMSTLTVDGLVDVTGTATSAVGVQARDIGDLDIVLNDGLVVSSSGTAATGITATDLTGVADVNIGGAFNVTNTAGDAMGIRLDGGTTQTIALAQGMTIDGVDAATGVALSGATGGISLSSQDVVSISGNDAAGVAIADGAKVDITLADALSVTGGDSGLGIGSQNASGAVTIAAQGPVTVSAAGGSATAVSILGGTDVSLNFADSVTATGSSAAGISVQADGGVGIMLDKGLNVTGASDNALGVFAYGRQGATVTLAQGATVSANGGEAMGATVAAVTGDSIINADGHVSVANTAGTATGLYAVGGANATINVAQGLDVTATGDDAVGVRAGGLTGIMTVNAPSAITATSDTGGAAGIYVESVSGLVVNQGAAITASSAGQVAGVYSADVAGQQTLTLGDISASSTGDQAYGVILQDAGPVSLTDSGTISVSAAAGGAGVSVASLGANSPITLALNQIVASGAGTMGIDLLGDITQGVGAVNVNVQNISTDGAGADGIRVAAPVSGATALVIGSIANGTHSGGVTTTGDAANGVALASIDGDATITNNGAITTQGANAAGIDAQASGVGALSVNSWSISTSGAQSNGVNAGVADGALTIASDSIQTTGDDSSGIGATATGAGGVTVTARSTTVSGSGSQGIAVSTDSGAAIVNATSTVAGGAGADAIAVTSTSGDVVVNLADGGTTSAADGDGVHVTTGGKATINVGSAADTAKVSGGQWGIASTADQGSIVNISASVTGAGGAAINLKGGASTINNLSNTIIGYVDLTDADDVVNNAGTWQASGTSNFAGGNDVVNNSGTLNVAPAASTATVVAFQNLESFNNSGTISLAQASGATPHSGDVLDLGSAAYVGSGAATLVLDANLGSVAVGTSAPQSADMLMAGTISGSTVLVINDLGATSAGAFNFDGIQVATADQIAAGSFTLSEGSANRGLTQYQLVFDGNQVRMVGLPGSNAFALVRAGAEAQRFWRRSADVWADQLRTMNNFGAHEIHGWMQLYGGGETEESRPTFNVTALGTNYSFNPKLDIRDSFFGGEAGVDFALDDTAGVGIVAGYGDQNGKVKGSREHLDVQGYNIGAYARVNAGGFFAHVLGKADIYNVKFRFNSAMANTKFDGVSWGFDLRAGYHADMGSAFLEPMARIAWTHSDLDGFTDVDGAAADYRNAKSAFGEAGLRAGWSMENSSGWTISPYAGAYYRGEMAHGNRVAITSGGSTVNFQDDTAGAHGRFEAGIIGSDSKGLTLFGKAEGLVGDVHGISGRAGVMFRW